MTQRRVFPSLRMMTSLPIPLGLWLAAPLLAMPIAAFGQLDQDAVKQRRERLESMSQEQRREFGKNLNKFYSDSFSESERNKLRRLHEKIAAGDDSESLIATMHRYYEWLKSVPPYDRAELENLKSPQERVEWIREYRQQQAKQRTMQARGHDPRNMRPGPLREENVEPLYRWLVELASRKAREFVEKLPEARRNEIRKRYHLEARSNKENEKQERLEQGEFLVRVWLRHRHTADAPLLVTPDDLEAMRRNLSPEAQAFLEKMSADQQTDTLKRLVISHLIEKIMKAQGKRQPFDPTEALPTEKELADYLQNEMDKDKRDWILTLPPEAMLRVLTMSYFGWWKDVHYPNDRFRGKPFFGSGPPGRSQPRRGRAAGPGQEDRNPPPFHRGPSPMPGKHRGGRTSPEVP